MAILDSLGDRIKFYERIGASMEYLMPLVPAVARMDGKAFSSFTTGLEKPWDKRFSDLMIEITKYLVKETGAKIGYTQSDEISLVFYQDDYTSQLPFNGRRDKLLGYLSAITTGKFLKTLPQFLEGFKAHSIPTFDARVFSVPNQIEAANALLWRERDATKNSILQAGQHYYSHHFLQGKNTKDIRDLLIQEKGINWNDYPAQFKRGTYIQRAIRTSKLQLDELELLPEKHHARLNPELEVERSVILALDLPRFTAISNPVDVIFKGQIPIPHASEKPEEAEEETEFEQTPNTSQ